MRSCGQLLSNLLYLCAVQFGLTAPQYGVGRPTTNEGNFNSQYQPPPQPLGQRFPSAPDFFNVGPNYNPDYANNPFLNGQISTQNLQNLIPSFNPANSNEFAPQPQNAPINNNNDYSNNLFLNGEFNTNINKKTNENSNFDSSIPKDYSANIFLNGQFASNSVPPVNLDNIKSLNSFPNSMSGVGGTGLDDLTPEHYLQNPFLNGGISLPSGTKTKKNALTAAQIHQNYQQRISTDEDPTINPSIQTSTPINNDKITSNEDQQNIVTTPSPTNITCNNNNANEEATTVSTNNLPTSPTSVSPENLKTTETRSSTETITTTTKQVKETKKIPIPDKNYVNIKDLMPAASNNSDFIISTTRSPETESTFSFNAPTLQISTSENVATPEKYITTEPSVTNPNTTPDSEKPTKPFTDTPIINISVLTTRFQATTTPQTTKEDSTVISSTINEINEDVSPTTIAQPLSTSSKNPETTKPTVTTIANKENDKSSDASPTDNTTPLSVTNDNNLSEDTMTTASPMVTVSETITESITPSLTNTDITTVTTSTTKSNLPDSSSTVAPENVANKTSTTHLTTTNEIPDQSQQSSVLTTTAISDNKSTAKSSTTTTVEPDTVTESQTEASPINNENVKTTTKKDVDTTMQSSSPIPTSDDKKTTKMNNDETNSVLTTQSMPGMTSTTVKENSVETTDKSTTLVVYDRFSDINNNPNKNKTTPMMTTPTGEPTANKDATTSKATPTSNTENPSLLSTSTSSTPTDNLLSSTEQQNVTPGSSSIPDQSSTTKSPNSNTENPSSLSTTSSLTTSTSSTPTDNLPSSSEQQNVSPGSSSIPEQSSTTKSPNSNTETPLPLKPYLDDKDENKTTVTTEKVTSTTTNNPPSNNNNNTTTSPSPLIENSDPLFDEKPNYANNPFLNGEITTAKTTTLDNSLSTTTTKTTPIVEYKPLNLESNTTPNDELKSTTKRDTSQTTTMKTPSDIENEKPNEDTNLETSVKPTTKKATTSYLPFSNGKTTTQKSPTESANPTFFQPFSTGGVTTKKPNSEDENTTPSTEDSKNNSPSLEDEPFFNGNDSLTSASTTGNTNANSQRTTTPMPVVDIKFPDLENFPTVPVPDNFNRPNGQNRPKPTKMRPANLEELFATIKRNPQTPSNPNSKPSSIEILLQLEKNRNEKLYKEIEALKLMNDNLLSSNENLVKENILLNEKFKNSDLITRLEKECYGIKNNLSFCEDEKSILDANLETLNDTKNNLRTELNTCYLVQDQIRERLTELTTTETPKMIDSFNCEENYNKIQSQNQILATKNKENVNKIEDIKNTTTNCFGNMYSVATKLQTYNIYNETLDLLKYMYTAQEYISGPENYLTLRMKLEYGITCNLVYQYDQGYTIISEVLNVRRRTLGELHPDTLKTMYYLADNLSELGYYIEAEELYKYVLEKQSQILGDLHPDTDDTKINLIILSNYNGNLHAIK